MAGGLGERIPDSALEGAAGRELAEIQPELHQRLRDLGAQAREDRLGTEQAQLWPVMGRSGMELAMRSQVLPASRRAAAIQLESTSL